MEFLVEYGMFLLKAMTIVFAIVFAVGGILAAASKNKGKSEDEPHISVKKLNERFDNYKDELEHSLLTEKEYKELKKEEKKSKKKNQDKSDTDSEKGRVFVIDFDGDVKASAVDSMREHISAILTIATEKDEVLVRLESAGGMVHSYGLAASQLARIREKGIKLSIAVDKVAASGGYMMACNADKVLAAPFAIIGSIGVIAQLPNFNKVLKKNDIDFEMHTAGEYKRTLTVFGENTDAARDKFRQDINETHDLFKKFVKDNRPTLDIDAVANGDIWYGLEAIDNGLIDEVKTSDEYIMTLCADRAVYQVSSEEKKTFAEKLGFAAQTMVQSVFARFLTEAQESTMRKG